MNSPYTHADHARACREAAQHGVTLSGQYVQARIGRTVCCARIVTAWDTSDGLEMWQLDLSHPIRGRCSTPARNVRQCSRLDGRCACAGEQGASDSEAPWTPNFSQAGVVAPPESLTHETSPVSGG